MLPLALLQIADVKFIIENISYFLAGAYTDQV
jgi:hypothetical protein